MFLSVLYIAKFVNQVIKFHNATSQNTKTCNTGLCVVQFSISKEILKLDMISWPGVIVPRCILDNGIELDTSGENKIFTIFTKAGL